MTSSGLSIGAIALVPTKSLTMRPLLVAATSLVVAACSACNDSTHSSRTNDDDASAPVVNHDGRYDDADAPHGDATTPMSDAGAPHGAFPDAWGDGSECDATKTVETWRYDATTMILRQSLCTHYEGPFLYLLIGEKKALLVDTGTGDAPVRTVVDALLANMDRDLIVAHSHAHGDHVGGDGQFVGRLRTSVVGHDASEIARAFGIDPASKIGAIDLGDRRVDVIAIPGHEATHVAFYDRESRLLLTGDTLYPGRLYVRDWKAYRASVARLVDFVDAGHPVSHVVGGHIELSSHGTEFAEGATLHPEEHVLELGDADLRDLFATVNAAGNTPKRTKRPSYVLVPLF